MILAFEILKSILSPTKHGARRLFSLLHLMESPLTSITAMAGYLSIT